MKIFAFKIKTAFDLNIPSYRPLAYFIIMQ